jgi:hypothetical protein
MHGETHTKIVKEIVELFLYCPSGPAWPLLGRAFLFNFSHVSPATCPIVGAFVCGSSSVRCFGVRVFECCRGGEVRSRAEFVTSRLVFRHGSFVVPPYACVC